MITLILTHLTPKEYQTILESDPTYETSRSSETYFINKQDFNYLIQDLKLSKQQFEV